MPSISLFIDAAMMAKDKNPRIPQRPDDAIMPSGTARVACVASSLMCTHESNAPIVHMGESQASMKAQPSGQVVKFSTWPKTYAPELIGGLFSCFPMGSAMAVATTRPMFR